MAAAGLPSCRFWQPVVAFIIFSAAGWRAWTLGCLNFTFAVLPELHIVDFLSEINDSAVLIQSSEGPPVQLLVWDPDAIVYVAVGIDNAPGVVGVDDDGNAIVDDRSELGATGSDDLVLTPVDNGYNDAKSGKVVAMVLSRGAMKRVSGETVIKGPGQVRIDVIDSQNRLASKIIDLK